MGQIGQGDASALQIVGGSREQAVATFNGHIHGVEECRAIPGFGAPGTEIDLKIIYLTQGSVSAILVYVDDL